MLKLLLYLIFAFSNPTYKLAVLKYNGGGDWYGNPTALTNLIAFCNKNLGTNIHPEYAYVEPGSSEIFNYPLIHMTGHGTVVFSATEAENLRNYLASGGFLHISDNYGMDKFIRSEMQKVLPDARWVELPFSHEIYHSKYNFPNGLPKIHEHDGAAPKGLALFHNNRMVVFYDLESDLGDGWENPEVHGDPEPVRQKALQMGANIVNYVFQGAKP